MFHFPAFEQDVVPTKIAFTIKRVVQDTDLVNLAALEALRSAPPELNPYDASLLAEDFPSWFEVNLLRSGIEPKDYNGPDDDVPVRFGASVIETGEVLVFDFSPSDSYRYNSFHNLDLLVEWGLLEGQRNHLIVRFVHGRGGDGFSGDLVSWLLNQGVDVSVEFARDVIIYRLLSPLFRRIRNGRRDRKARKIAVHWRARGLEHPMQLREFIDFKDSWTTDEVSKRLKMPKDGARELLRALGLEVDSRGSWKPGTSKRARRRRARWEAAELNADLGPMEDY